MKQLWICFIFLLLNLQLCYSQQKRFLSGNTIREKLSIGHIVEDSISATRKQFFYEIQIEKPIPNQDLVLITKGKTPFDDPEIRMSFYLDALLQETEGHTAYTCMNLGREVCIIPSQDLIDYWDKNGLIVVYILIFSRDEDKCSFSVLAEYETPFSYQFGTEHFLRLEEDMVKLFTLEFEDILNSNQTIQDIFISVIPTQIFLMEDTISLLGFLTEPTSSSYPDAKGVEIWEGGLGMRLKGQFSKGSRVFLKLIASKRMNFKLISSSPQLDQDLILQQPYKGLLEEGESCLFRINLSSIENHKEKSLVIAAHPYSGQGEVQLYSKNPQNTTTDPHQRSDIWGSVQIVVEKEAREKFKDQNGDYYYLKLFAKTNFAYSIRVFLFEPEKLLIDFQEAIQGLSIFHQIQSYRINVDTANPMNIFVMLINILGDSDLFVTRCPQDSGINSCQLNQKDIFQYYKDIEENKADNSSKFVVAKIGSQKREFSSFIHSQQSPTTYIISIVGQTLDVNKYILRVVNDVQHQVLQTGIPYKDSVNKFGFRFYSYKPTTSSIIEEVTFVLTPFTGYGTMRSSQKNKYPRMGDYEEQNDSKNQIIYYSKDYPNLQNTTFYIGVQGLVDSIYTITPFIKKKEETGDDAGVFLPVGFKQNLYLTQQSPRAYFYIKVPAFDGASKKADIFVSSSVGGILFSKILPISNCFNFQDIVTVILDKDQQQIRNNVGEYRNNIDLNKVKIPENTFTVETVLYGMVMCSTEANTSQSKQVSLIFNIGKKALALPINSSTVQLLTKKEIETFEFQIEEYTNYFISAQVQSINIDRVEFYVSLDPRNISPSRETNNGIFNPSVGFEISTAQIDEFCPFIKNCAKCLQTQGTCLIKFAGYAVEDLVTTISISNKGAIYNIKEGQYLSVPHPENRKFSYFILEVEPQRAFVEVKIESQLGDIQIYASIYHQKNNTYNSDFISREKFPTSQVSQFQSSYQSGFGSTSLLIQFQDQDDCMIVGCKILLSVDCSDSHFKKTEISMMNILAFSDKTIKEIMEGYDFDVNAGVTKYFKLFVREQTLNFRVEILNAGEQNSIGITVNHQSKGLPDLSNINSSDKSYLVSSNTEFLETGYYFIGVNSKNSSRTVNLRVSMNFDQVIHLNLDGKQRDIRIIKDQPSYLLIDLRNLSENSDLELLIFDVASSFSVKVFANEKTSLFNIQEIKEVEKNGIMVGEFGKISHGIILESKRKNTFWYVTVLKSDVTQELRAILRTKNTVQALYQGQTFNDVLARNSYRIFDLQVEKATLLFGIISGEIRISLLIPTQLSLPEWLSSAQVIDTYSFSNEVGATNIHELVTQKHQLIAGTQKLLIEAINGNEAFYSIRNAFTSEEMPQAQNLFLSSPIVRKIKSGETQQFLISNLQEQLMKVRLSVTFTQFSNENSHKPKVTIEPQHSSQIIKDYQSVSSSKAIFITLELSEGIFKVTISNDISDLQDDSVIEYVIGLDSSGITNLIEEQDYIGSSSSLSSNQFFQYFRKQSTSFIIQLFNCIGESTLAISDSIDAVESRASDLNIRSHFIPQQPFKMYTVTDYDSNSSLTLYLGARAVRLQEHSETSMFIINVKEFETYPGYFAQKSLLFKPFEELYLNSNGIVTRETKQNNKQTELKFQVEGVNCQSGCQHLRANVRSIQYDLFITTSSEMLQYHSVCSSHIISKQDQQQQQIESKDKLLLTKSNSTKILGNKKSIEFIVLTSELPKLSPLYVQVSAKVKLTDFGKQEVFEVPLLYEPLILSNQWWNGIQQSSSSQKDVPNEQLEDINQSDSSNLGYSFILIFLIILICIAALMLVTKVIKHRRVRNENSIQSIFYQDSIRDQELGKYHSQQ